MKRVLFLFIVLLIGKAINAQSVDKEVVDRVKAIVAYEMNVVSLKDNKKSTFEKDASEMQTVEDVKKCLPQDYKRSKDLCDEIDGMKSDFTDFSHLKDYYSDNIFSQAEDKSKIKEFLDKRKDNPTIIEDMKKKIAKRISELEPEEQENTQNDTPLITLRNEPIVDESEDFDFKDMIVKSLGYLIAFVAIALAVILFRSNRIITSKYNVLKEEKEEKDELLQNKEIQVHDLKKRVSNLEHDKEELNDDNRRLKEKIKNLEDEHEKQIQLNSTIILDEDIQNGPVEYYFRLPKNGKFSNPSEFYQPGKVLYKMVSYDDIHGDFEFIDCPSSIKFAKMSKTQFLEPACNIIGDDMGDFAHIETENKGKVERTNNEWKITKKADVRLV